LVAYFVGLAVLLVGLVWCWVAASRRGGQNELQVVVAGLIVVVLLIGTVSACEVWSDTYHPRNVTGIVKSRYIKSYGSGKDRKDYFMVEIESQQGTEVVQVRDSVWWLDWQSADTYAVLDPGKPVNVTVAGPRVPFLSLFPRVVRVNN
jgi:hypothetical protein